MTATNHALAGAAIALIIKEPLLALPLALASHFILDTLPHFGMDWEDRRKDPRLFKTYLIIETSILIFGLVFLVLVNAPLLVYACSILAMSPDVVWGYKFVFLEKPGTKPPASMNFFNRWHSRIQTRESLRPGMYTETIFALGLAIFVISQLL